jgi:hypothetical protein
MDWGVILGIVGIVIGLVALAVAIPPLFQMLYGRPRLEFLTDEFTGPDGKSLLIAIKNQPTRSRFLRKIGVEREIGNVLAYLDIQQQGTGLFVAKDVSGRMHCSPTREDGLLLARALPNFTTGVEVIFTTEANSGVVDARSDQLRPIGEGDYTAHVTIICGEQVHRISKNFPDYPGISSKFR